MKLPPPAEAFIRHATRALHSATFVRLLISKPASQLQPVQRIIGRVVLIKDRPTLSLTFREARRDTTRNLAFDEASDWLADQLASEYRSAVLETTGTAWQFNVSPKGRTRLISHKTASAPAPAKSHDRQKSSGLDESARPWLIALELCNNNGTVRPSAADKYRQLERYLEIFGHLVRDCDWRPDSPIDIVDMGCGKGYLTFGVWHLLNRQMGLAANVVGVEARQNLVDQANAIAQSVGATTLKFVAGDIASVELETIDALIALHACNTATDAAIARGVHHGAKLIVASPCCHQELRPKLGCPSLFAPLLEHGMMAERFSEWLTDGLRALRLEQAGYATKIIEFVASEHTPRNLLIAGVRKKAAIDTGRLKEQIRAIKDFFHLDHLASDDIISH